MRRLCLVAVLAVGLAAAPAQGPAPAPTIDINVSGSGTGTGTGTVTVSGTIAVPANWELSIHVLTVRFQPAGGGKSRYMLVPVKGPNFSVQMDLKKGSYTVTGLIDVKDADGREKQITGGPQTATIP